MLEPTMVALGIGMLGLFSYAIISTHIERRDIRNQIEDGDVVFTATVETPEPPPEPVIGEPLLEFVRLYKENHRRFVAYRCYMPLHETDSYYLLDRVTKEQFKIVRKRDDYGIGPEGNYTGLDWATTDELDYVVNQLSEYNYKRRVKMLSYKAAKAAKKQFTERDRLKKVYKA